MIPIGRWSRSRESGFSSRVSGLGSLISGFGCPVSGRRFRVSVYGSRGMREVDVKEAVGKMEKALTGSSSGHPPAKVTAPSPEWTGMWPVCVNCPELLKQWSWGIREVDVEEEVKVGQLVGEHGIEANLILMNTNIESIETTYNRIDANSTLITCDLQRCISPGPRQAN